MLSNTSCFPVLVKKFHVSSWLTALYTGIYSTCVQDPANNPARSPVHYHASHQLHQNQGLETPSFQETLTRNVNRIWSSLLHRSWLAFQRTCFEVLGWTSDISFTFSDTRKAHSHNNMTERSLFTAWFTSGWLQPHEYGVSFDSRPCSCYYGCHH